MKRWAAAAAAFAFLSASGCDFKEWLKNNDANKPIAADAPPSQPASPGALKSVDRQAEGLKAINRQLKGGPAAPTDEAAVTAGNRLFDGQTSGAPLSFADDAVVVPPAGAARRAAPVFTSLTPRRPSDLRTPAPPALRGAPQPGGVPDYPASAAVNAGNDKFLAAFDGFQRKMYDAAAPILTRAGWHAAARKGSPEMMNPNRVTVHHTEGKETFTAADTAAEARSIQNYHMYGRAREGKDIWSDIGYHYLIDGSGRVVEGRPADTLGAHARNANPNNVGIALMGQFDKTRPSKEATESLTRLITFFAMKFQESPRAAGFVEGHQHYDSTSCPGRYVMAMLPQLRASADTEKTKLAARIQNAPAGTFVAAARI